MCELSELILTNSRIVDIWQTNVEKCTLVIFEIARGIISTVK